MPQFNSGISKTARVTMRNPKTVAFDYSATLYMGIDLVTMSQASFYLNAKEEKLINFPVTMPSVVGTYPVHLGVFSGGKNIALYRATEDVVIVPSAITAQYVSGIMLIDYNPYLGVMVNVDIKNIGSVAGVCEITISQRIYIPQYGYWSGWTNYGPEIQDQYPGYIMRATIQPGATVTFGGRFMYAANYPNQWMVTSPAGKLLEPAEPKEFTCYICGRLKLGVVSFATQAELDAHIAGAHPQYAPMSPLTHLSVKGITWPEHFTEYGTDYGRIIAWYAIACLNMWDYSPEYGWSKQLNPDDGAVERSVNLPCNFTLPVGFVSAYWDAGGTIPNTTLFRVFFQTDRGWYGFMADSPWIMRIPNGSLITFEGYEGGCRNWKVVST